VAKPFSYLELNGMISLGDWNWDKDVSGYVYNQQGQAVNSAGNTVDSDGNPIVPGSAQHDRIDCKIGGIHVGNSAQTTAAVGFKLEVVKGFKVGMDGIYYGRNYSNFNISSATTGNSDMTFGHPGDS
jgi:hypothetical protein